MKKVTLLFTVMIMSAMVFAQSEQSPNTPLAGVPGATESMWTILSQFPTNAGGEQAIETDGQYFYTANWGATSYPSVYFKRYTAAGALVDSFQIPGVGQIRDLAYYGGYFYGGNNALPIYKMDFTNHTLVQTINAAATVATVRHLSVDPTTNGGQGGFWAGAWGTLYRLSLTGSIVTTVSGLATVGMYGSAWDNVSPGGPFLWIFDQSAGSSTNANNATTIYQFNIASQTMTGVTHNAEDIPGYVAGTSTVATLAGGLASSSTLVPGKFVLIGNVQQSPKNLVFVYELSIITGTGADQHSESIIRVSPNPSSDVIKVISGTTLLKKVSVLNQMGQLVYENHDGTSNKVSINVSSWAKGVYYVKAEDQDGPRTMKVVVD